MLVLVTGAGGYLGRRVVEVLGRRGHRVRALDLPRPAGAPPPAAGVEEVAADLCGLDDLEPACRGADTVVHLAARLSGAPEEVVRSAVVGTERLLEAMTRARVRRLVLASSLSVYEWAGSTGFLDEDSPLERHPGERDAYTLAKLRQERLAREKCGAAGLGLVVLRPAIIWGAGREVPPTIGLSAGRVHLVFAPARPLPAVHVENCADAFACAVDKPPDGSGGTFNVVDHPEVTAGRFLRDSLRRSNRPGLVVPVSYRLALLAVGALHRLTPPTLRARLPGFVAPRRFAARYAPVRVGGERLRLAVGWIPPLSYEECLDRTYGPPPPAGGSSVR